MKAITRFRQSRIYDWLLCKTTWVPVSIILGGHVVYHCIDWSTLLVLMAKAVACLMTILFNHDIRRIGYCLIVNGSIFTFASECTYLDLLITTLPLTWRVSRSISHNLVSIIVFIVLVFILNTCRIALYCHWYVQGVSATVAHDVPDYTLYSMILWPVVLLWFPYSWKKSMRR